MTLSLRDPSIALRWGVFHHYGGWAPSDREALLRESLADGFADVPYHWYVSPTGQLIPGRGEQYVNAANLGINEYSLSLCFGGNFDEAENPHGEKGLPLVPSDAQLLAAVPVLQRWVKENPQMKLILHRDVAKLVPEARDLAGQMVSTATACPGSRFVAGNYGAIIWKMVCGYSLVDAKRLALGQ